MTTTPDPTSPSSAAAAPAQAASAAAPQPSIAHQLAYLQFVQQTNERQASYLADRIGMLQAQALDQRALAEALLHLPASNERDQQISAAQAQAAVLDHQVRALAGHAERLLAKQHAQSGVEMAGAVAMTPGPAAPPQLTPAWRRTDFWETLWRMAAATTKALAIGRVSENTARVGGRCIAQIERAEKCLTQASTAATRATRGEDVSAEIGTLIVDAAELLRPVPWHLLDIPDGAAVVSQLDALGAQLKAPPSRIVIEATDDTLMTIAMAIVDGMERAGHKEAKNARLAQIALSENNRRAALQMFLSTTPPDPLLYPMNELRYLLEQRVMNTKL